MTVTNRLAVELKSHLQTIQSVVIFFERFIKLNKIEIIFLYYKMKFNP